MRWEGERRGGGARHRKRADEMGELYSGGHDAIANQMGLCEISKIVQRNKHGGEWQGSWALGFRGGGGGRHAAGHGPPASARQGGRMEETAGLKCGSKKGAHGAYKGCLL